MPKLFSLFSVVKLTVLLAVLYPSLSLTVGTVNSNNLLSYPIYVNGVKNSTKLVLDANWHWIHSATNMGDNCFPSTTWNTGFCNNSVDCWNKCAIQGIPTDQWNGTYGVSVQNDSVTLRYVTRHTYGINYGSRLYLLQSSGQKYYGFNMLAKELSFVADMSQAGCGLNGAIYFVQMPLNGGPNLRTGYAASVGLGYCDAQCTTVKFINGTAAGLPGQYSTGACCSQFDIWEANNRSTAMTSHVCKNPGLTVCNDDVNCGRNGNRYKGQCDMDGGDINPYRNKNLTLFGFGSSFAIDTSKPFTVKTQFITDNKLETGNLIEVKRIYVQGNKTVPGGSITDAIIAAQKTKYKQNNYQATLGGIKKIGEAFKRKMVLAISFWDDTSPAQMLWLDGVYPKGSTAVGAKRGPCNATSGDSNMLRNQVPNSKVIYSKFTVAKL